MHLIRLIIFVAFSGTAIAEEERVLSLAALSTEAGLRRSVEEALPGSSFGFYHSTDSWIIGALEDFDRDRIFLLLPADGQGSYGVELNGKQLKLPVGEPAIFNVAGALVTSEQAANDRTKVYGQRIGYWIQLKSTDRFRLTANITSPAKAEFLGTYDPDNGWQTSCAIRVSDQDRREPADAYEISRDSLSAKARKVLATNDKCVVRLASRRSITVEKWQPPKKETIEALVLTLTDKIEIGLEGAKQQVSPEELKRDLKLYCDAAMSAGSQTRVRLIVSDDTDDKVFRSVLEPLVEAFQNTVYLDDK